MIVDTCDHPARTRCAGARTTHEIVGHTARHVCRRFGEDRHPARLNFAECFSWALARSSSAPLLFKGDRFAAADIAPEI